MKSFLNACGLREPLRIVVDGPRGAGPRTLPQPFAVIGRDNRADLMLDDDRVSRRHVYLQAVAGHVFWIDLETRTGTCDETGTRKSGWLTVGGLLEIGPFVIRRAAGSDPALEPSNRPGESPLVVRAFSREPLPEVALEFLNGPSQATVWPMNRVMSLIGSAQGCKFRLTDPSVSPFHASLLRTTEGLWVVDLRGGRSITVNDEPVRFRPLAEGDVLGIGRYRIQIRCREPREASAGLPARRAASDLARRPDAPAPARVGSSPAFAGPLLPMPAMPMPPAPMPVVASATGVDLGSSDAAAPGRFQAEVSESVLVPLVNQFSMMQQQMFDQFQQAMGMMLQMFGTMHREQMDVIREELDRLHDLTRELQELKEELARNPQGTPQSPAAAKTAPARPAAPAFEIPMPPPRPAAAPAADAVAALSAAPSGPPPRPAEAAAATTSAAPTPPAASRPDEPAPGRLGPAAHAQGPAPGQDTVAWIHQRIMTIQRERETRWQKILKLLPGVS